MPRLLVVDDEPAIRHAFRRAFRDSGLTVTEAETAAEAVTAVAMCHPDVVVLDVHLPDSTGLDTYRRVRAVDARVPVVMITGHGTTELAFEAIQAGAFGYLLKPLDLPTLRGMIERAVQPHRPTTPPATMPGA